MREKEYPGTDVGAFLLEDEEPIFDMDDDIIWEPMKFLTDQEGEVEIDYKSLRAQLTAAFVSGKS